MLRFIYMNIPSIFPKASIELSTEVETDELVRRIKKSFNLNPERNFISIFFIEPEFFQGELNGLRFKIKKNDSFRTHSDPNLFLGTEVEGGISDLNGTRLIKLDATIDSTFRGLILGWFVMGILLIFWSLVVGIFILSMSVGLLIYMTKKTAENLELIQQKIEKEIIY